MKSIFLKRTISCITIVIFLCIATLQSIVFAEEVTKPEAYVLVVFDINKNWKSKYEQAKYPEIAQDPSVAKIFQSHFLYMGDLAKKGLIFMGGPLINSFSVKEQLLDGAMFVYKVSNIEEAEKLIKKDPLIINSVMEVTSIRPFFRGV
jgi:uncharacterized protein YciI